MTRYLTITGTLLDERTLRLTHGFTLDEPPGPPPPGGERSPDVLVVENLDADGRVLGRGLVPTVPLCVYRADLPAPRLAAGVVTIPERTHALRFVFHDREVHRFALPREAPQVRLGWRPDGEQGGLHIVRWDASHPERAELAFVVLYSNDGRSWIPLCLPQPEAETAVDFDELPGGDECRIRVMTSDGLHTAIVDSEAFPVRRKGPRPLILFPDDGTELPAGVPVTLWGQALSPEGLGRDSGELRWTSSLDGGLGTGPTVDTTLSTGDHTLTLTVTGGAQEAFVTVTVRPDPCRSPQQDDTRPD